MGTYLTFDLSRIRSVRIENGWSHLTPIVGLVEGGGYVMSTHALCGAYLVPSSIEPPHPDTTCQRCVDLACEQGAASEVIMETYGDDSTTPDDR